MAAQPSPVQAAALSPHQQAELHKKKGNELYREARKLKKEDSLDFLFTDGEDTEDEEADTQPPEQNRNGKHQGKKGGKDNGGGKKKGKGKSKNKGKGKEKGQQRHKEEEDAGDEEEDQHKYVADLVAEVKIVHGALVTLDSEMKNVAEEVAALGTKADADITNAVRCAKIEKSQEKIEKSQEWARFFSQLAEELRGQKTDVIEADTELAKNLTHLTTAKDALKTKMEPVQAAADKAAGGFVVPAMTEELSSANAALERVKAAIEAVKAQGDIVQKHSERLRSHRMKVKEEIHKSQKRINRRADHEKKKKTKEEDPSLVG